MFDSASTVPPMSADGRSPPNRKPTRLEQYYADKEAGVCTWRGCRERAADGVQMCAAHGQLTNERKREGQRRWRAARRREGLCIDCPSKSDTYRCLACAVKRGNYRRRGEVAGEVATERFRRHDDGRTRYHGQMRRGRQPASQIDDQDLEIAIAQLTKARDHLRVIAASPEIQAKPKYQRDAAKREALAMAEHGARFVEELLDRHQFGAGNELRMTRVSVDENKRRGGR